ncbi:MAG: type III polyketide synthase, partial [Ornithinimicrobium sp.]
MSTIAAVAGVLPEHRYAQAELTQTLADLAGLPADKVATLARIHSNAGVDHRHLALAIEDYPAATSSFDRANDAFIRVAADLGERAVTAALAAAGVEPHDVDVIISMTVTGLAVPSLDARLCARMPLRTDLKRIPIVGLGCV